MEIGWHLRFFRGQRVRVLVAKTALPVLEDQRATVSGWNLAVTEAPDHLEAVFSRK